MGHRVRTATPEWHVRVRPVGQGIPDPDAGAGSCREETALLRLVRQDVPLRIGIEGITGPS